MSEYLYTAPPLDRGVGLRRHIMTTAMHSFGGWGYREIQVPLVHYFDALKPGLDDGQIERSFRFVDRGGNLMVLRPDVTPAIAQIYAWQMRNVSLPLRVSYTHKVVRLGRSLRRNQLESYQLGVELIGGDELVADMEVLLLALEVLKRLKLPHVQVRLGDHQIANYLLESSGAPSRIREELREALVARDAHRVRSLLDKLGTRDAYARAIMIMVSLRGGASQLSSLRGIFPYDKRLNQRLDYLQTVLDTLTALGLEDRVHLELAELAGASYYTGIGFSLISGNSSKEVGRGGRYDELTGAYGKAAPAVGFSLSLEMLLDALHQSTHHIDDNAQPMVIAEVHAGDHIEGLKRVLSLREQDQRVRVVARDAFDHKPGGL